MPISSSVSRQSAAKPGQITLTLSTPRFGSAASTSLVYGCSQRARPKRDWNDTLHASARETELLRQQAGGALALRAIRIAQRDEALGNAVERHQQVARGAGLAAVVLHARGQRVDVRRIVVVARRRIAATARGAARAVRR